MEHYINAFKRYRDYTRSTRSEYWYFVLFNSIVIVIFSLIDAGIGAAFNILNFIYLLAAILPNIAITTRRLHDVGKSGWWQLIGFIPILGWGLMIYWTIKDSLPNANQYGENPKLAATPDSFSP